jgi:predicted phosphodiesterase
MSFLLPGSKDFFFYYTDQNGRVHRLQRNIAELTPGDWIHNSRPLPSKSKSPYLVSNVVGNDKKNITVFFKDNDGLIYEFRDRVKIKTDEIVLTQLLLKDSGIQASGVPAACKVFGIQYVFFKNTKNQLCLVRYADPSVADVELIVLETTDIDGNPQVLVTADNIIRVFFRNAGGSIFEVQYNVETKKWVNCCISDDASNNIDSSSRTPSCIGDPACIERVGTKYHVIHLFYRAADDTLRELFKRPDDKWKNISLRRYVSPADKVSSSPVACFTNEMHVYFMRSDNLLHEIWWDQGKKRWRHATISKRAMVTTDINSFKLWCVYNLCPHIMFANSTGDVCDVWWDQQWKFQSVTAGLRTAQPIALESLQIFGRQVELEESKIPASEKHDDEMDIDQDNLKDMIDVMNTEQFVPVPPPMPVTKLIEIADAEVKPKPTIIQLPLKGVATHEIQASRPLRIVIVSDTHNYAHRIPMPEGDILIHAGDFTVHGQLHEINQFDAWLGKLNYKHKIVIAGNHEMLPILCRNNLKNCIFLEDKMINVEGINIFGMKWKSNPVLIPDDADFLITHVPPKGFGDIIFSGDSRGDDSLAHMLKRKPNVKLHVFGQITRAMARTSMSTAPILMPRRAWVALKLLVADKRF